MATNPDRSSPLFGDDAVNAAIAISDRVRGIQGSEGAQPSFRQDVGHSAMRGLASAVQGQPQESGFSGLGDLLEASDRVAYTTIHNLVLRQEQLARNRWAQDKHWKHIKLGYTWSNLEKVQDQDVYKQSFPPGSEVLRPSAVPNKAADLCNKLVETLNIDPPVPSPLALDDSEESERAAELAAQFLKQDGGEQGTDDDALFWAQTDLATTSSSAYLHLWVDKTGGGWVPSQIKAHPEATDANNPLMGPDNTPTTDYILRYVTEPDEQGRIQFVENPSEAGRTWLPKIRVEKWAREHLRLFPEDKDLNQCETIVGLFYCTLSEAKRRWPDTVGQLSDEECAALCDWLPNRYIVLLPPALRSRWRLQTGDRTDAKGSSNDQRIIFYYACYKMPTTDYPEGAILYVNGANEGTVFERNTLSAQVSIPSQSAQDEQVTQTVLMEIPIVPIRLLQDPEERDPTGKAFIARIGSASEAQATLATAYLEAMDKILHPARFATATSPVESWQVEESRGTGDFVPVLSRDDFPFYEPPPPIPGSFFQMMEWQTEQLNSIASLPKPLQGADGQQEVSGVARRIAVGQAQVSLSRMQSAWLSARKRYWRIKLQLATKYFNVPQLLKFVGEDGAYKQEWFTGVDFSRVTSVEMQAGTGTMMPPQEKVSYVSQMVQMQFMSPDEAAEAARPTFSQTLGLPADTQQQRIERQVSSWLEGPPQGWMEQAQQFDAAMQAAQQQQAPQGQPPQAPSMTPTAKPPWTPFKPLATDDEPLVAAIRVRRLRKLIGTVRFGAQPERWQRVALDEYSRMRKAVADAAGAASKAESDKAIQLEQIKAQSAGQAERAKAQVALQANMQEAQQNAQIAKQELQQKAQEAQQKLQMDAQTEQLKLDTEQRLEEIRLRSEMQIEQMKQQFELQKLELEQQFELAKLRLQGSQQERLQADAHEHDEEMAESAMEAPDARSE